MEDSMNQQKILRKTHKKVDKSESQILDAQA